MECAHEELTTQYTRTASRAAASSENGDDDEKPTPVYASPEDELKAIYQAKTGDAITLRVLDAIRVNLEITNVAMSDFVAEVRKHAPNDWRNPAGFLRDLSKRFRAKTRPAADPVTAAEAAARAYQCSICRSRTPGEGALLQEGVSVPCECASQEYIARMRARGIFPQVPPQ
jgi:hypothetical protein